MLAVPACLLVMANPRLGVQEYPELKALVTGRDALALGFGDPVVTRTKLARYVDARVVAKDRRLLLDAYQGAALAAQISPAHAKRLLMSFDHRFDAALADPVRHRVAYLLLPDPKAWPQDAVNRARPRLWSGREPGFRLAKAFPAGAGFDLPENWRLYAVDRPRAGAHRPQPEMSDERRSDRRGGCRLLGPEHHPQRPRAAGDRRCAGSATATSPARAAWSGEQSGIGVTGDLDDVLADDAVEAVAIATPPATHAEIAIRCIEAGRHVLVEKPLADSYEAGRLMVETAESRGVVLHCDHTFCYTHAVQAIRDLLASGSLGDPLYYDSVRVNLGLVNPGDRRLLGPRPARPLDRRLHPRRPRARHGHRAGRRPAGDRPRVRRLPHRSAFGDGLIAHCHLNWLSPTKIRTTIVGGSERMVVWNDLLPSQRVSVYESGVDLERDRHHARRAAPAQGLLPDREHDGARAARARGAAARCCATGRARSARAACR